MPTKAKSTTPLSDDAIRHRAYLLWEADGRPDGMADHYWMKASQPAPDVSVRQKVKAVAAKTAAVLKAVAPKGKTVNPAEPAPVKAKAPAKAPKLKAAAAKLATPAVKAKPAAKAPAKKPAAKAATKKA